MKTINLCHLGFRAGAQLFFTYSPLHSIQFTRDAKFYFDNIEGQLLGDLFLESVDGAMPYLKNPSIVQHNDSDWAIEGNLYGLSDVKEGAALRAYGVEQFTFLDGTSISASHKVLRKIPMVSIIRPTKIRKPRVKNSENSRA